MRITTYNMQGSLNQVYLGTLIAQNNPDVICLQESGDMTQILEATTPIVGFPGSLTGRYRNGNAIYDVVFWYNNDVDANPRNSLAVMSRITVNAYGIHRPILLAVGYQPGNPRSLPWMTVNENGNLITIYSYHGPASGTAKACPYNNLQIEDIYDNNGNGIWSVVGDFNARPNSIDFVAPPIGVVVHGDRPTQQNRGILDYSITNARNYIFVQAGALLAGSDHYPQNFNYNAG